MKRLICFMLSLMSGTLLMAQGGETKQIDVDINTDGGSAWYTNPWVWVIGAAVFILLLVALTRSGRRAD